MPGPLVGPDGPVPAASAVAGDLAADRRGCPPERRAIVRSERPSARPREISSRSASDSTRRERRRGAGTYPPFASTTPWIEPACLPSARPISLSDSPALQRDQSSRFCSGVSPGRPSCAIRPPPDRHTTISRCCIDR